jgi:SUKH-3 immunity protein
MTFLPTSIGDVFVSAGWRPGRKVAVSAEVPVNHCAYALLSEFGGLKVGQAGSGAECATAGIEFRFVESDEVVDSWARLLDTCLVGVGEAQSGYVDLFVDTAGQWFGVSSTDHAAWFIGRTFADAVERLLKGYRLQPILRTGQKQVTAYGEVISANDPRIYKKSELSNN